MDTKFDLKKMDMDTIGSAPVGVKAVVLLFIFSAVIFLGYMFVWKSEIALRDEAMAAEEGIRNEFIEKKKLAVNLEEYKKQMVDIEKTFGEMLKQLPGKTEMDGLLSDINNSGTSAGLTFTLFRPSEEAPAGFYIERPVAIEMKGNYHQMGKFAENISNLSRIVTLGDVTMKPEVSISGKFNGQIVITANAKTYRYMDQDEYETAEKEQKENEKKTGQ